MYVGGSMIVILVGADHDQYTIPTGTILKLHPLAQAPTIFPLLIQHTRGMMTAVVRLRAYSDHTSTVATRELP